MRTRWSLSSYKLILVLQLDSTLNRSSTASIICMLTALFASSQMFRLFQRPLYAVLCKKVGNLGRTQRMQRQCPACHPNIFPVSLSIITINKGLKMPNTSKKWVILNKYNPKVTEIFDLIFFAKTNNLHNQRLYRPDMK